MIAAIVHWRRRISIGVALLLLVAAGGCAAPGARIDNIPMYGQPQISRPDVLKRADAEFIATATAAVGNREKASEVWAAEAERYLNEGNLDFAMRRYNQSWLLNPENYKAFWGFGRVQLEKDDFKNSVKHFQHAMDLIDDPHQKPALLSDFGTAYSFWANSLPTSATAMRARLFASANDKFVEATTIDPAYGNAWRRWAMSLYREGDYPGTWDKVKRARETKAPAFAPQFLQALRNRMPEPQ